MPSCSCAMCLEGLRILPYPPRLQTKQKHTFITCLKDRKAAATDLHQTGPDLAISNVQHFGM